MLNGYEELENFHDLDESELDYLGITEPAQRAKILTAVELMQDNSTTCKSFILHNNIFFFHFWRIHSFWWYLDDKLSSKISHPKNEIVFEPPSDPNIYS